MIDLRKKVLPDTVFVSGKPYKIKTDFQYWLMLEIRIQKGEIKYLDEADFIYDGDIPRDRESGFKAIMDFMNPKREIPRDTGGKSVRVIDFEIDADLIYSAFLEQYSVDLVNSNLHLHYYKFKAMLEGLHGTRLNEIMSYRAYDENNKDSYETVMKKMKAAWELSEIVPMSEEEKKMAEEFEKNLQG